MGKWFRAKPLAYQPIKKCTWCDEEKYITEFPKHSHAKDNLDTRCRDCIKLHAKVTKQLKKEAPPKLGVCDCCGRKPIKWCLDHDHTTNLFRGWVCEPCNTGIGILGDNIEGIQKALDYLKKSENNCLISKYGNSMPYMTKLSVMKALRRNFTTI